MLLVQVPKVLTSPFPRSAGAQNGCASTSATCFENVNAEDYVDALARSDR